jgi:hypothetical protein
MQVQCCLVEGGIETILRPRYRRESHAYHVNEASLGRELLPEPPHDCHMLAGPDLSTCHIVL